MNGLAHLGAVIAKGRLARLVLQFSLAILLSNTSIGFGENRALVLDGTNSYVLDLDGNTSYVELPPNIFNDVAEATVEGWVKWRSFPTDRWSRFFSYGE